ncbi:MAG: hypothetical protein JNJ77_19760 [Planctomycetia bacterium]|nr:hypothetical protein [Planctomycetia bacterium]
MRIQQWLCILAVALGTHAVARADFINGTFSTGNLTGWTSFTTSNGTVGGPGFPNVVSFDTTGSGASLAAQFHVGQVVFQSGIQHGGGILQTLNLAAGTYRITADFAAFDPPPLGNAQAGIFSVLLDGVTQVTANLGSTTSNQIKRGSFDFNVSVATGTYTFAFQMTRRFLIGDGTPFQYFDNIHINPVPVPSGVIMGSIGVVCLVLATQFRRRKVCIA